MGAPVLWLVSILTVAESVDPAGADVRLWIIASWYAGVLAVGWAVRGFVHLARTKWNGDFLDAHPELLKELGVVLALVLGVPLVVGLASRAFLDADGARRMLDGMAVAVYVAVGTLKYPFCLWLSALTSVLVYAAVHMHLERRRFQRA